MKQQKKQPQKQNLKNQLNKRRFSQKLEKLKSLYDSFPNYIDKSEKDLLIKYNL